jgi:outer membrane biogenesis lipoprotein LolB
MPLRLFPAIAMLGLLAACSTQQGDETGVVIQHSAAHAGGAQWQADRHCAQFGKKAVLAQKAPKQSDYLVETNVSTFDCVN